VKYNLVTNDGVSAKIPTGFLTIKFKNTLTFSVLAVASAAMNLRVT
jgi:hypothetical protein